MSGNTLGKLFRVTTFGESHGPAMGCIVDGCPPGLALELGDIQGEINRRRSGLSRFTAQRQELDEVEIMSGVFEGQTTGTPIALFIKNHDQKSKDYANLQDCFRPGHADYTYWRKYGIRDYRGGGRSSARETVSWVASGAIAKKYLKEHYNIKVRGCLVQMGVIEIPPKEWHVVDENPFFCADHQKVEALAAYLDSIRKAGDSIGARVRVEAHGVMPGLGEPVFEKLNADIAHALMSINAARAVEIGDGFDCVLQKGSEHRDEMTPEGFLSNHAGGILGGISTGQPIIAHVTFKPPASIPLLAKTINTAGEAVEVKVTGRHDPCIGIRAVPIAEAMLALVLMDHVLCFSSAQNKKL